MVKLILAVSQSLTRRWYVYVSIMFLAWGANAGWHYYQYLNSEERAAKIMAELMEKKRADKLALAKSESEIAARELSSLVSAASETKNRYDKAQACMGLNQEKYDDCLPMQDLDYEISFVPRYKKDSPSIIQPPKASAAEPEPAVEKREPVGFLKPSELLGPTKVSDKCYVSQTESVHVIQKNGGMFATDVACNFGEGLGKRAEVYAPDLRDKPVNFVVEHIGYDELLGSFIQLVVRDAASGSSGTESFYLGHTETKLKEGDVVKTGQRIGQMTLNGATTGWHVHFEYRRLGVDGKTWKSERYFTGAREEALDNKRKGSLPTGWKWGDTFYFTHYDLGDVNQNDSAPCHGASGRNLCDLEKNGEKTIALTVDVRNSLGVKFGDKVRLDGPCSGTYQVEDEMNQRFRYACVKKDGLCIKGDIPSCAGGPHSIHKIR